MTEAAEQDSSVEVLLDAVADGANQLPGFADLPDADGTVIIAPGGPLDREPAPEISYEEFGSAYIRSVLHRERVLSMINDVLGPTIELGPNRDSSFAFTFPLPISGAGADWNQRSSSGPA